MIIWLETEAYLPDRQAGKRPYWNRTPWVGSGYSPLVRELIASCSRSQAVLKEEVGAVVLLVSK